MIRSTTRITGTFAGAILILAACGGGASPSPSAQPSPSASAEASAEPSGSAAAEVYTVNVVASPTLGDYLTGEDGKTLYVFKNDTADTSACATGCIEHWPAFTLEDGETVAAGTGVTGTFGTITRADGKVQVTYDHHPLYYYEGDSKAGDTNGQGMANLWVVAPVTGAVGSVAPSGKGNY